MGAVQAALSVPPSEYSFDLFELVLYNISKDPDRTIVWSGSLSRLVRHPLFRFRWCLERPSLPWDPSLVSRHVPTIEDVLRAPEFSWVYGRGGLSSNPHARPAWVNRLPGKPWDREAMAMSAAASDTPRSSCLPLPVSLRDITDPHRLYTRERRRVWNNRTAAAWAAGLSASGISGIPRTIVSYLF